MRMLLSIYYLLDAITDMNVGNLNKRITITVRGALTPDTIGGYTKAADTESLVWCGARQLSHRETLLYGLQVGEASYEFTFRYETVKNISQVNGLKYEGRTFRIISINEVDERKEMIKIIANEQTN